MRCGGECQRRGQPAGQLGDTGEGRCFPEAALHGVRYSRETVGHASWATLQKVETVSNPCLECQVVAGTALNTARVTQEHR